MGKQWKQCQTLYFWAPKSLQIVTAAGECNGTPLSYSCLENPQGWGTWLAAVYGVAQSRTQLKWLSSSSNDCSHEIKRRLLLGMKVMTSLDSILKSTDIILPTKIRLVKAIVFPVVMYGYESWSIKKAECWRIDAFELWCWSFNFSISPSNEYSGQISLQIDWLDLLAVQGTLKSLLQHHSMEASILWCSDFFMVQLSHSYMTTGKNIALIIWIFVGKVMSLLFYMLSRFAIAFLPRIKSFNFMASVTIHNPLLLFTLLRHIYYN